MDLTSLFYRETSRRVSLSQACGSHVCDGHKLLRLLICSPQACFCPTGFPVRNAVFSDARFSAFLLLVQLRCFLPGPEGQGFWDQLWTGWPPEAWQASLPARGSGLWVLEGAAKRGQGFRGGPLVPVGRQGLAGQRPLLTAQCGAALPLTSSVSFRSLGISHRFWGSPQRLERVLSP